MVISVSSFASFARVSSRVSSQYIGVNSHLKAKAIKSIHSCSVKMAPVQVTEIVPYNGVPFNVHRIVNVILTKRNILIL